MAIINEGGYASFATFECPHCRVEVRDIIFVPFSSSVDLDEHGLSTEGEAKIMCGHCTKEYLLNVRNSTGKIFAKVHGYSKLPVVCSGAFDPDELGDLGIPWDIYMSDDTPSDSLVDALTDVKEVIKSEDAIFYVKPLSRMAFIQLFAALEAYLADTLTKQVLECPNTLNRALIGVKDLRAIKLTLSEIAANPDIVNMTAAKVLRGMLYHNFMKVDAIWNIALGFSLFPNDELKERVLSYEPIRHDCVHRNGRDKDGKERTEVNFEFVIQMAEDVHDILNHIEDNLCPYFSDEDEA